MHTQAAAGNSVLSVLERKRLREAVCEKALPVFRCTVQHSTHGPFLCIPYSHGLKYDNPFLFCSLPFFAQLRDKRVEMVFPGIIQIMHTNVSLFTVDRDAIVS